MTGERQSAETALSNALAIAERMADVALDHPLRLVEVSHALFVDQIIGSLRRARAALPASTESTGALTSTDQLRAEQEGRPIPFEERYAYRRGWRDHEAWTTGAASGGVPAALDVERLISSGTIEDVAAAMHAARITGCAFTGDKQACSPRDHVEDAKVYLRARQNAILARSASEPAGSAPDIEPRTFANWFLTLPVDARLNFIEAAFPDAEDRAWLARLASSSEPEAPGLREALERLADLVGEATIVRADSKDGATLTFGTDIYRALEGARAALQEAPGTAGQPAGTTNP